WEGYYSLLLYQQLLLLFLVTPALAAGALGHEKERGTLTTLFCTELTARQIVLGKLLGRLALLARSALVALPPLAAAAVLCGRDLGHLLGALLQAAVLGVALTAACLLAAVWTRRTADAILACYATLVLAT